MGVLDGGPIVDLITANFDDNTVSVLPGDGLGVFGPEYDFDTGESPQALALSDLNADGLLDVAVVNYDGGSVSVLLACPSTLGRGVARARGRRRPARLPRAQSGVPTPRGA